MMKPTHDSPSAETDFRLLTIGLEKAVIAGKNTEQVLATLGNQEIWQKLSPGEQIHWANLCRMAGEPDLAVKIYDHLHQKCPDFFEAWQEHLELLYILNDRQKSARIFSMAKSVLSDKNLIKKLAAYTGPSAEPADVSQQLPVADPFEKLRKHQQGIECFLERFSGKEDAFARQWVNRDEGTQGYVPVRRPICAEDIEMHLKGTRTYGIYLIRKDNTIKTAVIDADLKNDLRNRKIQPDEKRRILREKEYMITRIKNLSNASELFPLVEFSGGKGYHFWYFFDPEAPASRVRAVLNRIAREVIRDLTTFNLEVFPKQDQVGGKGFGNLVKLPLGVHRLTGKKSFFIQAAGKNPEQQLEFIQKAPVTHPEKLIRADTQLRVIKHPRWKNLPEDHPELAVLEQNCPPLGMLVVSCLNGNPLSVRESKVLYQTIGFLHNGRTLMHYLSSNFPEYNPHEVDFALSKLKGNPLGCRRIHRLLNFTGDFCRFSNTGEYDHPLKHFPEYKPGPVSTKVKNLDQALKNLQTAVIQVQHLLIQKNGNSVHT